MFICQLRSLHIITTGYKWLEWCDGEIFTDQGLWFACNLGLRGVWKVVSLLWSHEAVKKTIFNAKLQAEELQEHNCVRWCHEVFVGRTWHRLRRMRHVMRNATSARRTASADRSSCADRERHNGRRRPGRCAILRKRTWVEDGWHGWHGLKMVVLERRLDLNLKWSLIGFEAAPEISWWLQPSWALGLRNLSHGKRRHCIGLKIDIEKCIPRIQGKSGSEAVNSGLALIYGAFFLSTLLFSRYHLHIIFT